MVGVLSPSFVSPEADVDVWCPVQFGGELRANREARFFTSLARLKPGVSRQEAETDLRELFKQNADPRFDKGWTVATGPLLEAKVAGVRRTLWVLGGAVGLLLLIACANVASLLIAQGRSRQREIAMRVSLGASRGQVVRQLLTESATLAVVGALAGLVLAWLGIRYFQDVAVSLPRVQEVRLDLRILCFTAGLSILTGILSGLFPALPLARRSERSLAGGGRGQIDGGSARTQSLIAMAQVAMTLVLLVGAGLMIRALVQNLGCAPEAKCIEAAL